MKRCSKCGIERETLSFRVRKDRPGTPLFSVCRVCERAKAAEWKLKHPERTRELSRKSAAAFFARYPERVRENSKRSIYHRLATNPEFRMLHNLRRRLNRWLHGTRCSWEMREMLGAPRAQVKAHFEALFSPGMTWENYGKWHVDHVKPCARFDCFDPVQQKACFYYRNLQPLWAVDNLRKGAHFLLKASKISPS